MMARPMTWTNPIRCGGGARQVEMFWFAGCEQDYRGPLIRNCTRRAAHRVVGERTKCIVRPENVDALAVHYVTQSEGRVLVPNSTTALRFAHYKPGRLLNTTVEDASLAALAPAVCAEIRRAGGPTEAC